MESGVTYVPLRLVCEALGCKVEWDPYLGGAAVTSPGAAYDAVELYWLSRIIYAESGAESMTGQIAVGNVILNRVESSRFPNTVEGVIFDRKDAVQFEPVSNGQIYKTPSAQSVEAARRVLDGENVIGSALYFYAPALSQGVCDQRQLHLSADHRLPPLLPLIQQPDPGVEIGGKADPEEIRRQQKSAGRNSPHRKNSSGQKKLKKSCTP